MNGVDEPTVAVPVPVPVLLKNAYAPTAAMATTAITARREIPFFVLMNFICFYLRSLRPQSRSDPTLSGDQIRVRPGRGEP